MYYIKYFNATKAYQKAYESSYQTANVNGPRLLVKASIKAEIDLMKEEKAKGIMLDVHFVLQKYIDIAFADITDFTSFGKREIEVTDDLGNVEVKEVNYVDFKNSDDVDGTIITEVKQGRDGVSVKLADKLRALEFLAKYTELLPEHYKRKLEEEKLKAEIDKIKGGNKDEDSEEWIANLKAIANKRRQLKSGNHD